MEITRTILDNFTGPTASCLTKLFICAQLSGLAELNNISSAGTAPGLDMLAIKDVTWKFQEKMFESFALVCP